MRSKRRRATGNVVRQRELVVDSFVRDGARSGYREGFERGLSMYRLAKSLEKKMSGKGKGKGIWEAARWRLR